MNTIAEIKIAATVATKTVAALHAHGDLCWELAEWLVYCRWHVPGQRAFFAELQYYLMDANAEWDRAGVAA